MRRKRIKRRLSLAESQESLPQELRQISLQEEDNNDRRDIFKGKECMASRTQNWKKDLKARKTVAGDVKRNNTPLLLFHRNSDICF